MGNVRVPLVGAFHIRFQQNLCFDVSDTWKVHVRASVNQALLRIDIAGICKCPTNLVEPFISECYGIYVLVVRCIYQTMI
jgi:hypothetical protein